MGLSTRQVYGDQGDWDQTLLQSGTAEETKPPPTRRQQPLQQQSEPLKCPRCSSTNTKFCYFNNYNKSQPRHFCKSCKRHWTKGGTLRNVPVGGGRKNKRPKISNASTTTSSAAATTVSSANFPLNTNIGDKKSMSNILYHALFRSSPPSLHNTTNGINISIPEKPFLGSNGIINTTGLNIVSVPQIPRTEFPFSNLNTFDMNAPLINPTSYQPLNSYDRFSDNLDSVKESTSATVNIPSTSSMPLACLDTSSTVMDLPNYWNWNEIDVLTSSDDLNIAWDDDGLEIKI